MSIKLNSFLGRFNYLSFRSDSFNVLFVPPKGVSVAVVARDLPRDVALGLVNRLNTAMEKAKEELEEEYEDDDSSIDEG